MIIGALVHGGSPIYQANRGQSILVLCSSAPTDISITGAQVKVLTRLTDLMCMW